MKRDLIGSAVVHAALLLVLAIISSTGASLPPPVMPEDVMMVTPVDAFPAARVAETGVPEPAEDSDVPDIVEIADPTPEAIPVEPKKPEPKVEKPKPEQVKKPAKKPAKKPVTKKAAQKASPEVARVPDSTKNDGIYESTLSKGAGGKTGGSLLGMSRGTPGGRVGSYPDRITNRIYSAWTNPVKLQDEVSCSVVFRVSPAGKASQIALDRSSGLPAYDNSTIRAVWEVASTLPPFPRSLKDEYIVMRITFVYTP